MHYRYFICLLAAAVSAMLLASPARADLSTYTFQQGTGTRYDATGGTEVFHGNDACDGTNIDDNASSATDIGFSFYYDGVNYTKFSVSTNGLIGLFRSWGSTNVTKCWTNDLDAATGGCFGEYSYTLDTIPQFGAFWDDLRVPNYSCRGSDPMDGVIRYKLFGSAPSRVLVIDYDDIEYDYYGYNYGDWQVRLYEGSNKIEFWYGGFGRYSAGDGGSIGLAAVGGTSFISVTPGSPATASTSTVDDYVDPTTIAANTLYTFNPCNIQLSGNTAQGGTTAMAGGDTLLLSKQVQVGSTGTYQPFTFRLDVSPCTSRSYSIEIVGSAASQYTVTPASGSVTAGSSVTPTITYRPTCAGRRAVTLRITGSDGLDRTYTVLPTATAQAQWTGNIAQGGTASLASGDTLLGSAVVLRGYVATFRPITIANTNSDPSASALNLTFTIDDPSGQYSIAPAATALSSGQSVSPAITFTAQGVAHQEATLTVSDGCDTRTFMLRAFSAAPGGYLTAGDGVIDSTVALMRGSRACVGEGAATEAITMVNTGYGDFIVTGIDIYQTDTLVRQGTSPYPLRLDEFGNPVRSSDYLITLSPGTAPLTPDQALSLPFAVPQGQSRTIYLTYVGTEPGRRYARIYIQTNGQNLFNTNVDGIMTEGMVRFDAVAGSIGARLSADAAGKPLRGVVFPNTSVGDTTFTTFSVANSGACDLRIDRDKLSLFSGDINEFKLMSVFPATAVDARGDYVIAPGSSDVIIARFTPSRSGTRIVTLFLQTNDSTLWLPGLTERGSMYIDLFGYGRAGLEGPNIALAPVLVGGMVEGTVVLVNATNAEVSVGSISFVGGHAAEFSESSTTPWPALPRRVLPGDELKLNIQLQPTGVPGMRRTFLQVISTMGDTVLVGITGEAGTQELTVAPTSLFDGVKIAAGEQIRRTVQISNTGTFPVRLQTPTLSGTDAANYRLGVFPRLDLMPGQTEFLEVTFAPTGQGASSAQIDFVSNGGNATVLLGGEAERTFGGDPDPRSTGGGNADQGVTGVAGAGVLELTASLAPNPARQSATMTVTVPRAQRLNLTLHDSRGTMVLQRDFGPVQPGRFAVELDLRDLASGTYRYRLTGASAATDGSITVVR